MGSGLRVVVVCSPGRRTHSPSLPTPTRGPGVVGPTLSARETQVEAGRVVHKDPVGTKRGVVCVSSTGSRIDLDEGVPGGRSLSRRKGWARPSEVLSRPKPF